MFKVGDYIRSGDWESPKLIIKVEDNCYWVEVANYKKLIPIDLVHGYYEKVPGYGTPLYKAVNS